MTLFIILKQRFFISTELLGYNLVNYFSTHSSN